MASKTPLFLMLCPVATTTVVMKAVIVITVGANNKMVTTPLMETQLKQAIRRLAMRTMKVRKIQQPLHLQVVFPM